MINKNPRARIEGESEKAYQAFIKYIELGEGRTIAKVGTTSGEVRNTERWSSKYNWINRIKHITDYDEEIKQKAHDKTIEEMTIRHTKLAQAMQIRAGEKLKTLDPDDLSPRDVSTLIKSGVDIERQARGVSDKIEMDIKGNLGVSIQLIETSVEEIKNDKLNAKQDAEN